MADEVQFSPGDERVGMMDDSHQEMLSYMEAMAKYDDSRDTENLEKTRAKMDVCLEKMSRIVGEALGFSAGTSRVVFRTISQTPDRPHANVELVQTLDDVGVANVCGCYDFNRKRCYKICRRERQGGAA